MTVVLITLGTMFAVAAIIGLILFVVAKWAEGMSR